MGATDPSNRCLYELTGLCETLTSLTKLHLPSMQLVQAHRTEYVGQNMSTCLHVCQGQWRPAFGADSLQFSAQLKEAGDDLTLTGICRQVQRSVASSVVLGSVCSPLLDELLHCCCSAMQGCVMQWGASCICNTDTVVEWLCTIVVTLMCALAQRLQVVCMQQGS